MIVAAVFAVALVSNFCPLLNIEAFLLGTDTAHGVRSAWLLAAAAALGQTLGKVPFFALGRSAASPAFAARLEPGSRRAQLLERPKRWLGGPQWDALAAHPWGPAGLCLLSAFVGLPPCMVVTVALGCIGTRWQIFVLATLLGRFVRFAALLEAAGAVQLLMG